MGKLDRGLRVIVALVLGFLVFTGKLDGMMYNIALALGAIFLLTSAVSFCPLYLPLGINTCEKN